MTASRVNGPNNVDIQAIYEETGFLKSNPVGPDVKSKSNIPVLFKKLKDKFSPPQDAQSKLNRLNIKLASLDEKENALKAKGVNLQGKLSKALVNENLQNSIGYMTRRGRLPQLHQEEIRKNEEKKKKLWKQREELHQQKEILEPPTKPPAVEG